MNKSKGETLACIFKVSVPRSLEVRPQAWSEALSHTVRRKGQKLLKVEVQGVKCCPFTLKPDDLMPVT